MTNSLPQAFIKLLLIAGALLISSCNENNRDPDRSSKREDSLRHLLEEERTASDSLRKAARGSEIASPPKIFFGKEFRDIENPEAFIKESLQEKPELISLDPVLGGKMEFRKVVVLSDKWVMAYYDDGHIEGKAIYEYQLQPKGAVNFTEIATDHSR